MAALTLPTISDVVASTHVLSSADSFTTVVRVGKQFAVKYGRGVHLLEAENMRFLASTSVPVPKVYGFMEDQESNRSFIVMDYFEGMTLQKILPSLTSEEKQDVFSQIKQALDHLRALSPPDFLGSIGRKPFADGIFTTDPIDPVTSGPFENQSQMNEGILRRLSENCGPEHVKLLRKVIESTLKGHRTVFTHADLQPKNILVRRTGISNSEKGSTFDIRIIDWEMSGWYPEYWEFCNATVWDDLHPEWLAASQNIMNIYPSEYLMLKLIRSVVFLLG
nr:hypothetical protein CFP56_11808 [Quercus suber]